MKHKKIIPVIYCPNCGSNLNDQYGFNPNKDYDTWDCKNCGMKLINPKYNTDVSWYCDNCGTFMNSQYGFNTDNGIWICEKCGFENDVSINNVYGVDGTFSDFTTEYEEIEDDVEEEDNDYYYDTDYGKSDIDDKLDNYTYTIPKQNYYNHYNDFDNIHTSIYTTTSSKSRFLCLIIWYFFGIFGGHYFYVGKTKWGFIYMFTAGLFALGWLFDFFRIFFGHFTDKDNNVISKWF